MEEQLAIQRTRLARFLERVAFQELHKGRISVDEYKIHKRRLKQEFAIYKRAKSKANQSKAVKIKEGQIGKQGKDRPE